MEYYCFAATSGVLRSDGDGGGVTAGIRRSNGLLAAARLWRRFCMNTPQSYNKPGVYFWLRRLRPRCSRGFAKQCVCAIRLRRVFAVRQ